MKYLSEKMQNILERLSEMFPGSNYQSSLDAYLSTKGITDAAQLENYVREFNYSQKGNYLWNHFLNHSLNFAKHLAQPEQPHTLLVRVEYQKPRPCMASEIFNTIQDFEHKYGERIAAFTIVAIVAYLVIAQ